MILQRENKILREKAKRIGDLKSPEIKALIKKMAEAMFAEPDGIGIAAPQVGAGIRIFLVAKDILRGLPRQVKASQTAGFFVFIF